MVMCYLEQTLKIVMHYEQQQLENGDALDFKAVTENGYALFTALVN